MPSAVYAPPPYSSVLGPALRLVTRVLYLQELRCIDIFGWVQFITFRDLYKLISVLCVYAEL